MSALADPRADRQDRLAGLRHLRSVVVAVVHEDGRLIDSNDGFQRLHDADPTLVGAVGADVSGFFILPGFDLLTAAVAAPGEPVYRGVLNLGTSLACRSVIGTVHRDGAHLVLSAEFDVAQMELLTAQVVQLNEELAETHRELMRSKRSLVRELDARHQIEAALGASEAFLDKAGRIGGVGGWAVEVATMAVQWTVETCRIHDLEPGHRPTLEEVVGHCALESRPLLEQALRHCLVDGHSFDLELPFVTAGGRSIWVRVLAEPELLDGKPVRIVGAIQDITVRHALEDASRSNHEMLASVLENLPCGLSVFDADLRYVAGNAEYRRLLGLPDTLFQNPHPRLDELVRFSAVSSGAAASEVEAVVQDIIARTRATVAQEYIGPGGAHIEIRRRRTPSGSTVATYTDVTARRMAEAEARRNMQLLLGAIETIDEAFALFDPQHCLVFCNDKYRNLYDVFADWIVPGVSYAEIIRVGVERGIVETTGDPEDWIARRVASHGDGRAAVLQRLPTGRVLRTVDRRMPNGYLVGFRVDVTELTLATDSAQAASLAKSRFLANMSHELRTPMNAILGMLALLRKTDLTSRQADYAGKSEGAARALLGLLNDILDFSKIEAGKMTLDLQPFRIDTLLRDLSVILANVAGDKPLELLFDIDPALPSLLLGDAMRLQQVLVNLGGNAIKFTARGEIVLSMAMVEREPDSVTVDIAMRDTGIGIAAEHHALIFSDFSQAEASTTRRFGGTGLGLTVSQRLVALMGGELALDSTLGEGSRFSFRIRLPVPAGSVPIEGAAGWRQAVMQSGSLRTLLVCSNPTAREVLARMGRSLGWTVDVAASGEQALSMLQMQASTGEACDAVILDEQMPGLDGWETARQIRTRASGAAKASLFLLAASGSDDRLPPRSDAELRLIDGRLVKPLTASMLFDAVLESRSAPVDRPAPGRQAGVGAMRLAGLRLLLVEDNVNNQQVARELLEGEGALVRVAGHGAEAVEAVARAGPAFDAVLMDLQMPVMDGYTATRRIHELPGMHDLPIVALTANAMASDREACLAAGMNDYVAKPFELNHLVGVLRARAGRRSTAATDVGIDEPALSKSVGRTAAAAGVDLVSALARMNGQHAIYARVLRSFVDELVEMEARLQAQAATVQMPALVALLHTLRGLAGTLGITGLARAATHAERQLASNEAGPDAARIVAQDVGLAIASARPGLVTLWQAMQPVPSIARAADFDAAALRNDLEQLAQMLGDANMAATVGMDALEARFGAALGALRVPLALAIGALDFERGLD
ncbi:MAG: PAS-domain containing protein, partial [Caldimonas sp.]